MIMRRPVKLSPIGSRDAKLSERDGWRIAERFSTPGAEASAMRQSVGLADLSASGKIMVHGREALAALQAAFGRAPAKPGEVMATDNGLLACLTRDQWYLTTPLAGETRALERLNEAIAAAGVYAHATDLTHANGAMLLAGPQSRAALAKLCGLDLHPAVFPNHTAAQSGLAKVSALIIRDDLPASPLPVGSPPGPAGGLSRGDVAAYQIHLNRSEADYVWGAMLDAGGEYGIQPIGFAALQSLSI